mmetsp:Transcript_36848/g.75170  ORF Transcript_36848/g.75170 Transcript_36848/m.75170 type:complete len:414 (+) Transcript_36848:691-1932(+)
MVHHNPIRQVRRHDEVVLHNEGRLLGMHDEALDDLGAVDPLLRVKVRGRLINQVHIRRGSECEDNGESLELSTRQGLHAVVDDVVDDEGLHAVRDELGMHVRLADPLVQELPDGARELGRNFLGLVADVEVRNSRLGRLPGKALFLEPCLLVALQEAGEHADESGLAGPVLAQEDDDLRICEGPLINVQNELRLPPRLGLGHGGVLVVPHHVILLHLRLGPLRHLKGQGVFAEPKVLGGNEPGEEGVDTHPNAERHGDNAVPSGLAVQDADVVGEIIQHREVVLHHEHVPPRPVDLDQLSDHVRGRETLLHVQVRGRLVEHVHVRNLNRDGRDREPLKLPARKDSDLAVHHVLQFRLGRRPVEAVKPLGLAPLVLLLQDLAHESAHGAGDVIDVLRLDRGLHGVLQDLGEVVL